MGFYDIPEINPRNEAIDGAVFTRKRAKLPFLTVFIQVEDIKEKAKLIHEKGSFIVDEPIEIPGGSKI